MAVAMFVSFPIEVSRLKNFGSFHKIANHVCLLAEQFGPIFHFGTVDTNMSFCEKVIYLTWTS
jgi:hypothetical protein